MSEQQSPIEIPPFVAEGFIDGLATDRAETTEIIARDATWKGKGPVPDQRSTTAYLSTAPGGGVVITQIDDVPREGEDRLVFSRADEAIEHYREVVTEAFDKEREMTSAAGQVTLRRSPADHLDIELEVPPDIVPHSEATSEEPPCNRCGIPIENLRTIGEVAFCDDCHDKVCSYCGDEILDNNEQYVIDNRDVGTTCTSCTAGRVDWLCTNCGEEIHDDTAQIEIERTTNPDAHDSFPKGVTDTYCADCESIVKSRRAKADPTQDEDVDPPF